MRINFTSNDEVYTNKWNILQKRNRAFTSNDEVYTNKWNILQGSRFRFCRIAHLLSNDEVYTNKWNILQESRFPLEFQKSYLMV